jgi:hypothetical protein
MKRGSNQAAGDGLEHIKVGDLFKRLTIPQLWAVLGSIAAIIGAVSLGTWHIHGYLVDREIKDIRKENASLAKEVGQLREKERLLSTHKLYMDAVYRSEFKTLTGKADDLQTSAQAYVALLKDWHTQNRDGKSRDLPKLLKSHDGLRVQFPDGTIFLVPDKISESGVSQQISTNQNGLF